MRLVCPNCDAKYEVPDDAVPEGGRDVQCSSCGHAWFQLRPEDQIAAEEEAVLFGDHLAEPAHPPKVPEIPSPVELPAAPAPVEVPADIPIEAPVEAPGEAPFETPVEIPIEAPSETDTAIAAVMASAVDIAPASPIPKHDLDEGVLAVLREEAAREADLRRTEAQRDGAMRADAEGQMQTQPDLGMDNVPATSAALSPTQRRLAMLKGKDPDAAPPEPPRPAARRDLLPDVEEINSTLQPSDASDEDLDAQIDALPDLTRRGSGFRSGFFLVILLMVVAAAVYVAAPKLIAQFPAMESSLTSFVGIVDGLRLWLNEIMNTATQALKGSEG